MFSFAVTLDSFAPLRPISKIRGDLGFALSPAGGLSLTFRVASKAPSVHCLKMEQHVPMAEHSGQNLFSDRGPRRNDHQIVRLVPLVRMGEGASRLFVKNTAPEALGRNALRSSSLS